MNKTKVIQQDEMPVLLLVSIFVVATCGLIYELVAGTLASYLLGDSVTQFSTIIGTYLFAMGIGSFLSKYINKNLLDKFIQIEILVGLVGGTSSTLLFILFEQVASFRILLYGIVLLTGTFVGLEIPLLMRILENRFEFKELISRVFTFDYIGALLASVIFPLLLVPYFGLLKTSYFFGILNVGIAMAVCWRFQKDIVHITFLKIASVASLLLLITGFIFSEQLLSFAESMAYSGNIIYAKTSPYQRIVLTRNNQDLRLFLNGNLQFSSQDEYRYHEALVHLGLQAIQNPQKVLVLGGGDGLAVREILKYPSVKSITLVDLDPSMTVLFSKNKLLSELNQQAFYSPKVKVINDDAFVWLRNQQDTFDFIVIDFPDPSSYSIGKLYSNSFYKVLYKTLADNGAAVIQSTSPFFAPNSFWCVNNTLQAEGFQTVPYHVFVPSFGDWGYVMALKKATYQIPTQFIPELKFITAESVAQMMYFPPDMAHRPTEINKLNNQALVEYFESEWSKYTVH